MKITISSGQYHFTDERGKPTGWHIVTIPEWWSRELWRKAGGTSQDRDPGDRST